MNCLSKILIIIAVAGTVMGCAPPIGSIDGNSAGSRNTLIAAPKRTTYDVSQPFERDYDLTVFLSYRGTGTVRYIPISQVEISIIEDVNDLDDKVAVPRNEGLYIFYEPGIKLIEVEYNGMSDMYYVDVLDPDLVGGGSSGEGGAGIQVEWDY